ncbi:hypothetical protein [Streptomyces sp. NPDC101150]|uniref:hypothetical protein n=1 Tax=Streptomyces sp. NPDC101150 TaxID=3366114 RepID=UPI00380BFAD4
MHSSPYTSLTHTQVLVEPRRFTSGLVGLRRCPPGLASAIIFNALAIVALIPFALRGVRHTPTSADDLLRRNLAIYGLYELVAPFAGIKLTDVVISGVPGLGG